MLPRENLVFLVWCSLWTQPFITASESSIVQMLAFTSSCKLHIIMHNSTLGCVRPAGLVFNTVELWILPSSFSSTFHQIIVISKPCSDYVSHLAVLVMSVQSNNASDMQRTCQHLFTSHAAHPPYDIHILLWSFPIDSLWVISNLMACERCGKERTFGSRYPEWQRWSEMGRMHSETRGGWRQNKVINNLLKFGHKRRQSRSSHPWLYSKVPITLRQKSTARGWHSTIKQIISSWRSRKKNVNMRGGRWGEEDLS